MLNQQLAQTLNDTLMEATDLIAETMTLRHLSKHGMVTLEEAEFYHNLAATVITEAAEDFIPDEVEVPDAPEEEEGIELYDAAGNAYLFDPATGSLTPIDAPEGADDAGIPPMEGDAPADATPPAAGDSMEESTIVPADAAPIEESTQIQAQGGASVVAKILANLKGE